MSKEVKDRRAVLKSIVAGSAVVGGTKALPEQWSKPLTDSVMLPGHARTTGDWNYGDAEYEDGRFSEDTDFVENDGYGEGRSYEGRADASDTFDNETGDYSYGDTNGDNRGGDGVYPNNEPNDGDSTGDGV